MAKHPLLPEVYTDSAMHRALLEALKPYVAKEGEGIFNAEIKWDLRRARGEAEPLLHKAVWIAYPQKTDRLVPDWELAADTDEEVAHLQTIIAGLVARQIQDGELGFTLARIDYREGGEVALVVTKPVLDVIRQDYPDAEYYEHGRPEGGQKQGLLSKLGRLLKRGGQKG